MPPLIPPRRACSVSTSTSRPRTTPATCCWSWPTSIFRDANRAIPTTAARSSPELDARQCRDRFIPRIASCAASAPEGYRVYGLNLGDMTHSEYWYSKNYSFPQYIETMKGIGFPVFHAIGNHDYCHKVADDTADAQYKAALGPTYYSFNLGSIHYIVLDDMVYKGANSYAARIDDRQMEWLRRDLAAMDPAVRDVVVGMHVPTVSGLQTDGSYKKALENFDEFYALFAGYNLTVLSGHWHHAHSVRIGDTASEYILPAVCGTWWYELLCNDGTPAAFTAFTVDGTSVSRRIVPFGETYASERYRVYNKGSRPIPGPSAPALPPTPPEAPRPFWSTSGRCGPTGPSPATRTVCRPRGG